MEQPETAPEPVRQQGPIQPPREPAINLPSAILAFCGVLVAIHAVRVWLLSPEQDDWSIVLFAFFPSRYGEAAGALPFPLAAWWSPLTYSFLHADWMHLAVNALWAVAFGTPLVRRIGGLRASVLAVIASVAGAGLHYVFHIGEEVPMIGASAIVSGFMGAASRFAFQGGQRGMLNVDGPALSLRQSFSDPRFLTFLLVWFGINFIVGSGLFPIMGESGEIAWQAHVGGFLAGVFAFSLVDTRGR